METWGTGLAQSVRRPTLGFSLHHGLTVGDSLSPSLSAPRLIRTRSLALSLSKINKLYFKNPPPKKQQQQQQSTNKMENGLLFFTLASKAG